MADLQKLMPLLVSMRAMCDALLLEIAAEGNRPARPKGLGLTDEEKKNHVHRLAPGMGPVGICLDCNETVAREVKDG